MPTFCPRSKPEVQARARLYAFEASTLNAAPGFSLCIYLATAAGLSKP
jgi:hypothetical protein